MMVKKSFAKPYLPGVILFLFSLVIALLCFKDYGVGWDEPIQRDMGEVSYNYVFKGDKSLLTYVDRSHGVAFELPLFLLEKALHITDTQPLYLMRHLVTHLFYLVSVFCGYVLAYRLFKDRLLASLGFILLAFNPRLYAHSFFNSKDIPFYSALIIVLLVTQVAFEKKRLGWFALLGIVCAYATSIRAMGILFAVCISLFFIADIFASPYKKENRNNGLKGFVIFFVSYCAFLYLTWPLLWSAPLHYFKEEFLSLSHIYWEGIVLLNGTVYHGDHLPWFYTPVWFSITTPILWLAAGLTGTIWVIVSFFRNPVGYLTNTPQRNYLLYVLLFALPVISVVALNSINYDDWRHLYFIYPPFVILALFVIQKFSAGKKKWIIAGLCTLQVASTSEFMIKYHPHQQVYFNNLVDHKDEFLRTHYDLDYWGCAYKQGYEYILAHDTSSVIRVWQSLDPVKTNRRILPKAGRDRIRMVAEDEQPTYFITNFRLHPGDYPYTHIVYEIKVLNSTILRVYKIR